ncbi:unnamed protein product [Lymnaea stagnalis]|uniref:Uncharacterized protein n=1 Tax=Lymnaea stagnalis TaxID=6523 RepID=A0AAV2HQR6_LYMST
MWLQIISLAAVVSAVRGMCFGVPLLQQPAACPDTMVYYSQLCICIEPKYKDRLQEIGSFRQLPMMTNNYMDTTDTFKNKLDALRHRLTASLPDMANHGHGSSIGDVRTPLVMFPDRFFLPSTSLSNLYNQVPRSWRIGGLLESWSNDALAASEIPTVNAGGVFSPATSGWGTGVNDLSTLSLMDRLHTLRSLWRDATQAAADNRLGDAAQEQEFLKHLPHTGISPDTARSYFPGLGFPDSTRPAQTGYKKIDLQAASGAKKELDAAQQRNSLKEPIRRNNSFLRSIMRLQGPSTTA